MYRLMTSAILFWAAAGIALAMPDNPEILSLSDIQQEAQMCHPDCPEHVTRLRGMTDIDAFVLDPDRGDIILVGRKTPGKIALRLSDLGLALQATQRSFARREGNRIILTELAVSLDPSPEDVAALMAVGAHLAGASSDQQLRSVLDRWISACETPHEAKVYGMPRHVGIALSALTIDYEMKKQISGAMPIPSESYVSLADLTRREIARHFHNGTAAPVDVTGLSRFWISPRKGYYHFDRDAGAAVITSFGLEILTEQQKLAGNKVVDRGGPGRLPSEWAKRTTELIPELIAGDEDWQRVDQFARMLAIADMMDVEGAVKNSGLSLDWLIHSYDVPVVEVPESMKGHANVHKFELNKTDNNLTTQSRVVLPSCGGVSFRIEMEQEPSSTSQIETMSRDILKLRGQGR